MKLAYARKHFTYATIAADLPASVSDTFLGAGDVQSRPPVEARGSCWAEPHRHQYTFARF